MTENISPQQHAWHLMETTAVLQELQVDSEQGLATEEVLKRRTQYGTNELIEKGTKNPLLILWEQFTDAMVVVLIVAAGISFFLHETLDAFVILAIVILNAVLGFVQEYRAEQAMAALKRMAAPVVRVRREGHIVEVESRELVPGDIVLLEAGGAIPADARVIEEANLRVQEAALTGESEPVDKYPGAITKRTEVPLGDRYNMLFKGTNVTYGRGTAVIVETGMHTQLGRIAALIQGVESEPTPLQRRMAQLGRSLAVVALVIVAVVFALGVLRGEDMVEMFFTAIAMAVAAVPEGLPAVVTIALALGAQRMLKRRALIRKLPAVEALGSITVICSDKTGTLTENRMTVTILDVAGNTEQLPDLMKRGRLVASQKAEPKAKPTDTQSLLLVAGVLCNDAVLQEDETTPEVEDYYAIGDPTEGALLIAGAYFGLWQEDLVGALERVAEVPFSSERKRMTTVHKLEREDCVRFGLCEAALPVGTKYVAFTKGAVDGMLQVCGHVWVDGKIVEANDEWKQRIEQANNNMAQQGLRVLGLGFRTLDEKPQSGDEALENDLVFVGMVAMVDPPRPEVRDAVHTAVQAGIRPVMITGDHPLTARYIAQDLDIIGEEGRVITGVDLSEMSKQELKNIVEEVSVYARVSPEHKLRIVETLQNRGHIAAMTGDGVNDAPALRKSDIGVAMGITGTDVSKEAGDMVILDDNFATIVAAIEEGRNIFDNVRKFIKYTMTSNAGEIVVMLVAPFLGMPIPLTALQILWINLVTDGLPGLALGIEPPERNVMHRPPFAPDENIFARGLGRHILIFGTMMGMVSVIMGLVTFNMSGPDSHWQTMVFTTITLSQMGHALSVRSGIDSLFKQGLFSNRAMLGAVLLTFVLQLGAIYLPVLNEVFNTEPLQLGELVVSLALSSVVFWGVEFEKLLKRRKEK